MSCLASCGLRTRWISDWSRWSDDSNGLSLCVFFLPVSKIRIGPCDLNSVWTFFFRLIWKLKASLIRRRSNRDEQRFSPLLARTRFIVVNSKIKTILFGIFNDVFLRCVNRVRMNAMMRNEFTNRGNQCDTNVDWTPWITPLCRYLKTGRESIEIAHDENSEDLHE